MGTIVKRQRLNGGMAYLARIRLKRDGRIIHRESRTFESHKRAVAWMKERETELARPGVLEQAIAPTYTLADAIERYTSESRTKIGRTKEQVLNSILAHSIAGKPCETIKADDLVAFAKDLLADKQPQTVGNYMSHLAAVFAIARPAWGYPLDRQAMEDAAKVTRRLGFTSKSKERDRRPTLDELDRIMGFFAAKPGAPMHRITAFALFSTRRLEEITRLQWDDLDEVHSRILIRDMKHPGQKQGNHTWCDLPAPALAIIKSMPNVADEIFPFNHRSISAAFTRATQFLAIDDLHFHDLRHDGISRLFEMGYAIPQAATVSGHRSWQSLKRYTHIRAAGDKYQDWPWLERVTQPRRPDTPQPALSAGARGS